VLFPVNFTGKFTPFGSILGENHKNFPQTAQNHVKINNFPKKFRRIALKSCSLWGIVQGPGNFAP